jgi:hypothetical protein
MSGAAFVFARAGDTGSQQAYVKASNTLNNNQFGTSVALSSDGALLAVGAPFESSLARGIDRDQTQSDSIDEWASGAVYLFARDQGTWSQQTYVKEIDSKPKLMFGTALALAPNGSMLFVCAPYERNGTAYSFTRNTTWSELASATRTGQRSFTSVVSSYDGSTVAIGTHDDAVYVYPEGILPSRY